MGTTYVTTSLSNLAKSKKPYTASFLVDTGAMHCMGPRKELRKAGILPEGKSIYELANGQPIEYEHGSFQTITPSPLTYPPKSLFPARSKIVELIPTCWWSSGVMRGLPLVLEVSSPPAQAGGFGSPQIVLTLPGDFPIFGRSGGDPRREP